MTSQDDFLRRLAGVLGDCSIPYMVSGSFGSSFHGQPRATRHVDIVIAPTEQQLLQFVDSLGEDYYVSLEAARDALVNKSMFNIIDIQNGWKADFVIRKDRPFSRQEFERKYIAKLEGLDVWMASPEDIILSKLEWGKENQSERQFHDALGVAVVQWCHLDTNYLQKWAKDLGIEDSLKLLLQQGKELSEAE